jgi:hypothetical protein
MMEFWLSGSLSHELFLFSRCNLGYHGAFSRIFLSHDGISAITEPFLEFFFHMMESRLSRSLFRNFSFTWWNLGYHRAFSQIFLSHDGILAITEPFHKFFFHMMESRLSRSLFTNFSFTWWNLDYHGAFSQIFLSHDGILAITEPFHKFSFTWWNLGYHGAFSQIFLSHDGIQKMHDLGEDSFHIYHKEYLHRICLVKNLASWFRSPFARKRVQSSLF